jgi:hypothetical protein
MKKGEFLRTIFQVRHLLSPSPLLHFVEEREYCREQFEIAVALIPQSEKLLFGGVYCDALHVLVADDDGAG